MYSPELSLHQPGMKSAPCPLPDRLSEPAGYPSVSSDASNHSLYQNSFVLRRISFIIPKKQNFSIPSLFTRFFIASFNYKTNEQEELLNKKLKYLYT
jgi:hypothetical protein